MKKLSLFLGVLTLIFTSTYGQEYLNWEDHSIDEIYKKVDLPVGSLDESGNRIDYVYVVTELEDGIYEVEISDGSGDLYEVNGTEYFISFMYFYGFAGFADEGILVIDGWTRVFYEKE